MLRLLPLGSQGKSTALKGIERRYGRLLPIAIVLGLIASAFEALSIALFVQLSITLLAPTPASPPTGIAALTARAADWLMPSNPMIGLSLIVLAMVCGKSIAQVANAQFMAAVEGRAGRDIRDLLARKLLHLDFTFFLKHDTDRVAAVVHTDSWQATEAVRIIFNIAASGAAVLVFTTLLLFAEWRLSLIVLAGVGVTRLLQWLMSRHIATLGRGSVESNQSLAAQMMQIVRAIRIIRLFGQEPREEQRFRSRSENVRVTMQRVARWSSAAMPLIEVTLSALILVVLLSAGVLGVPLATTAAFLVLMYRVQSPLMAMGYALVHFASLRGGIESVEWLLDQPDAPASGGGGAAGLADRTIRFDHVDYAYPRRPDELALHDLSFELPPGSVTALVGASGAGKSTVINLIARLVEPSAGRICVDDVDIASLDARLWRDQIALAGQDVDMAADTVRENIAYGCPDATDADIEEAARGADAHDFIMQLPQQYDTQLGSLGFGLSGGQRQRIGLARALVRRPEILILDEATSAVDGPSERAILTLLQQHRRFGRAIVISHRRATLSMCDNGIVIERGRIIERGPLRELDWYRRETIGDNADQQGTKP